jgi:hypothetical protein
MSNKSSLILQVGAFSKLNLVEGHLRDKKEAVAWKIKFITEYTVTKHTNITTIYMIVKTESMYKSN